MNTTKPWCTCDRDRSDGWSHIGDQIWVHPSCGKQSLLSFERWTGMDNPSRYFTLPPRGITVSTATIGMDRRETYTYFCDANPECYAVAYGSTDASARAQLSSHICPAPARRDAHPSGRPVVQKAWDELDDVIDAIKANPDNPEYMGMTGDRVKGYAQGVAEVLAFLAIPYFRFAEDILKHANRRWRVRHGELPWEATPGYNLFPAEPLEYARASAVAKAAKPAGGRVAKRAPVKPATIPAAVPRTFTSEEVELIRTSLHDAGIPAADLAKMYMVSPERITAVAGPKDSGVVAEMPPMFGLF